MTTQIQEAITILEDDALTNRIERALEVLRGEPQRSQEPMSLEKPDGWIVKNRTGGVELFLDHERAAAALSAWGSSIGPLYAGPDTRPDRKSKA